MREVERRIALAGQQVPSGGCGEDAPAGIPDDFERHIKLMFDLQVLAWQADITRVTTLMFAKEVSNAMYPGERHSRSVSQPVASLERAREQDRFAVAQSVSREDVRVSPGEAAGHAGR